MHSLLKKLPALWKPLTGIVFGIALALPACGISESFQKEFALHRSDTSLSFIWASDLHYRSGNLYNFGITPKGLKTIAEEAAAAKADFLALTGDLVHGKDKPRRLLRDYREITRILSRYPVRVLRLIGNHDNGSYYASLHGSADVLDYSDIMDNTWYYEDFPQSGIRVICLNSCDVPVEPEGDGLKYYSVNHYAFGREQLKWLAEALRVPENTGCVIFSHIDTLHKNTDGFDTVNDILDCYRRGTVFRNEYMEADFSEYPSHELAGVFSGHIHRDKLITDKGTPHIITDCAFHHSPNYKGVTISRSQRRIYITDKYGKTEIITF